MDRRNLRMLVILAVASAALLLLFATGLVGFGLLQAAPAVFLAIPLLAGRYIGEDRLLEIASRRRSRRPNRVAPSAPIAGRPVIGLPRGGRLIAMSLAVRPPPSAFANR